MVMCELLRTVLDTTLCKNVAVPFAEAVIVILA